MLNGQFDCRDVSIDTWQEAQNGILGGWHKESGKYASTQDGLDPQLIDFVKV